VKIRVDDPDIPDAALVGGLDGGGSLPAAIAGYLDRSGNDDGTYDVGDLRAYLTRVGRASDGGS